ncbi:MAG: hypothetical protein IJY46_04580 [Lentisphaeria bacterium]|nr:hypothetical protein [Lentisphaeria bacterium]
MRKTILLLALCAAVCCQAEKFPIIFCQAQLKYPISSGESKVMYYSNWVDTPLLISSRFPHKNKALGKEDFRFMSEIARDYGFSGFGFWRAMIRTKRRSDFLEYAEKDPVANFKLIPFISRGKNTSPAGFYAPADAPRLLNSPAVMEINGKKLFWTYSVRNNSELEKYQREIARYGKNFIIIQSDSFPREVSRLPLNSDGTLHPKAAAAVQKIVRSALDKFGGFVWGGMSTNGTTEKGERVFYTARAKAVLAETAKVFAEPKYKGKIFGGAAVAEHSNAGRLGATLTSDGTRTLRNSVTAALDAGAQIINIPEWDEQNENTSLRPTVYNSFAYMRILRYITMSRRGEKKFHLASDDLSIPNVIISTRKSIVLGEILKIELLSIPDTADERGTRKVKVMLYSPEGKEVYASKEISLDRSKMSEFRLELPSEKFAGNAALQLKAVIDGKTYSGFTPVRLQATWNNDYKYAKHPLRNMLINAPEIKFSVTANADDNDYATVSAEVDSPEMIRFAEVIENGDGIYTHGGKDRHGIVREDDDFYAFRINFNAIIPSRAKGSIAITGAEPLWYTRNSKVANGKYSVNNKAMHWFTNDFLKISKKCDPAKVTFDVRINGSKKIFTLAELLKNKTVILPFPKGVTASFTRQLRQLRHPEDGNFKKFSFKVPVMPDLPVSTYVLQLITTDGKLYRSKPVILNRKDTGKKVKATVWSDTLKRPVTLTLPENFVPVLEYGKVPFTGVEEANTFGRRFWGVRGSFYNLANLRLGGGGSCSNGCSAGLSNGLKMWGKISNMVPEKARNTWTFKGGEHIALPPGTVPRRAAFSISFKICPEELGKEQFILGCKREYIGVLNDLVISKNGALSGNYFAGRSRNFRTRNRLIAGQWNTVTVTNDMKNYYITINGKTEKIGNVLGPGLYDMPTTVGCWEPAKAFKGKISDLKFSHAF